MADALGTRPRALYGVVKRVQDLTVATMLLVLAAPVMAVLAAAIVIDSGRPVLFRVQRVGYQWVPLRMLKFRKMRRDAAGPALTRDGDVRLTRVGRVLAATKLDELPQLWNVLRGEMSLVGPRPESPEFVDRFRADYADIVQVRPGILGLSQIAFAAESRILGTADPERRYVDAILPQKIALDRFYAEQQSLLLDLRILFWGFVVVALRRPVSVDRRTGRMRLRRRSHPRRAAVLPRKEPGNCPDAL